MEIDFYSEEQVLMPKLREDILRDWIEAVAQKYNKVLGELCYFFCSDEYILKANREFLQHDYYTDIITFDNTEEDCLAGDLLISLETVESNAELMKVSFEDELHRVIIHGILHMTGLGDKEEGEALLMRQAEDEALIILRKLLPEGESLLEEAYQYKENK